MSDWSYQGALIVRGLWEIQHVFEDLNIEQFLHEHLNFFQVFLFNKYYDNQISCEFQFTGNTEHCKSWHSNEYPFFRFLQLLVLCEKLCF